MRGMNAASLGTRLAILFTLSAAAVFVIAGWLIEANVERHFVEQDMEVMTGKLDLVRHAIKKVHAESDLEFLDERLGDAMVGHHGLEVSVRDRSGRVLFSTLAGREVRPGLVVSTSTQLPSPKKWDDENGQMRGFAASADTSIQSAAPLVVTIALGIDHHEQFLAAFRMSLAMIVGMGILAISALSWGVTRRALRPIKDVARRAQTISADCLDERLQLEQVPRELRELGDAFNSMLARLQISFVRLREFSSDLAHELRTPLTNLVTQTQVALSRERTAEQYRETLFSNLEEVERLARMVTEMLFLAKSDNGLLVPNAEQVAIGDEGRALCEYFEPSATDRNVTLICSGEALVSGDRAMLRRALANLISNAIRHADQGSTVQINIERHLGQVQINVTNVGETIQPEILPRVFERFYRADPARTRDGEGAGLGLAITQSIISAHGGSVEAHSNDRLTTFSVRIPYKN